MALFSVCRNLFFFKGIHQKATFAYSEFHTLKQLEKHVLKKKNNITPSKRSFFWIFRRHSKREIIARDQPPDSYKLIYRHGIDHYFLVTQYWVFYSSIVVLLTPIWMSDTKSMSIDATIMRDKPSTNNELLGFVAGYVVTICILSFVLSRMPVRIYHNSKEQKYLLYSFGPIPNQVKKIVVKRGEIKPLLEKGPLNNNKYSLTSGLNMYLFENYFHRPADLYVMLGWQEDPKIVEYEKEDKDK